MNTHDYFEEIGFWPRGTGVGMYAAGFLLSLVLTIGAYLAVTQRAFSPSVLACVLLAFALAQFLVQAICFLHLAGKGASRERLAIFTAAVLIVLILVSGSLWIMTTLNGRMMPSTAQMEQYMQDQSGF